MLIKRKIQFIRRNKLFRQSSFGISPSLASRYEIGAHLIEPNTELDCRRNWLGDKSEERVWARIFDRKDRYNLAKIAYIPYLLANNINTELALERPGTL